MPVTMGRASRVFGGRPGAGGQAEALAAVIHPAFLAEAGWDAGLLVLRPPAPTLMPASRGVTPHRATASHITRSRIRSFSPPGSDLGEDTELFLDGESEPRHVEVTVPPVNVNQQIQVALGSCLTARHRTEDTDIMHAESLAEVPDLVAVSVDLVQRHRAPRGVQLHGRLPPDDLSHRLPRAEAASRILMPRPDISATPIASMTSQHSGSPAGSPVA